MGMMMGALLGCRSSELAPAKPEIAITIDDFDVNVETPRLDPDARNAAILATLQAAGIRAAAFVAGKRVDTPDGKRRLALWSEAGHMLANHSYSHWNYPRVDFEAFSADVLRAEAVIASYPTFRKLFRFPYLKEGATAEQRDRMRAFLKAHGYRMGYVTVDASDWAINARLHKRLEENPQAPLDGYRDFYIEHIWERTQFYDSLARRVLNRPVRHTLLIHHNLLNALFLADLLQMYARRGWRLIDAATAFEDPIFVNEPDILPAGESILWAMAKESGKLDAALRYPAEDEAYERKRMDELGL
ncbi:polysaccharide deacetylase [Steroidobacter agaridevorans]|uniref:Polysaccharide deacetylase n=2 Tax=Steroidobacter agaridevorans TaxID=2695856 RepID=A0A829YBK1_9GAMM|nr:polysaccharide deacetylase [Steroidobacter agaridevorans]GFE87694.1 polysaccharide deacetylase [Steroidobacter agaridevorans]